DRDRPLTDRVFSRTRRFERPQGHGSRPWQGPVVGGFGGTIGALSGFSNHNSAVLATCLVVIPSRVRRRNGEGRKVRISCRFSTPSRAGCRVLDTVEAACTQAGVACGDRAAIRVPGRRG